MLYDPVYGMLEQASPRSVKRGIFPHLLILLHLCNEFQTPPTGKKMEYGLYHLRNIPSELVTFLTNQLKETEQFILSLPTMVEQAAFQKQLFQLPRVRLRTLLRNNGGLPTMTNEQHSIFHIQFFVVGVNLLPMEEGAFTKKNRNVDSKVGDTIRETWAPSQVFLSFTDAGTTTENIPFRFFEIDYEKVRVNESGITVGQYSGALDALRTDGPILQEKDAYVDRLAELKPFAVYNDAELALSTLMAIKEHMPK
jgi:hypothetical protein